MPFGRSSLHPKHPVNAAICKFISNEKHVVVLWKFSASFRKWRPTDIPPAFIPNFSLYITDTTILKRQADRFFVRNQPFFGSHLLRRILNNAPWYICRHWSSLSCSLMPLNAKFHRAKGRDLIEKWKTQITGMNKLNHCFKTQHKENKRKPTGGYFAYFIYHFIDLIRICSFCSHTILLAQVICLNKPFFLSWAGICTLDKCSWFCPTWPLTGTCMSRSAAHSSPQL